MMKNKLQMVIIFVFASSILCSEGKKISIEMIPIDSGIEFNSNLQMSSMHVGKYPVTQYQFETILGYNPSKIKNSNYPVDNINWYEAIEFCNKLSTNEGLIPVYIIQNRQPPNGFPIKKAKVSVNSESDGFSLPTSDEWKYFAYGGKNTKFYWGNEDDDITIRKNVWIDEKFDGTIRHEVGLKTPNGFGLYDIKGLGCEWCQNRPNNTGTTYVQMGGGYNPLNGPDELRSNFLTGQYPETRAPGFTMRIVKRR